MNKSTDEIRQSFLNFFYSNGHKVFVSSSLVPNNDPSLLFTNAGMNQFKNVFLGIDKITYPRIATSQHCIRVGGKHNDLENVGYSTYHHTFFEMLGNFSFNDYFKKEAIQYAWELLTSKKWFNLQKERLLVTVHESDRESYEIWEKKIGIPHNRIVCIKDKKGIPYSSNNFWQMGDTGPCGPCTEIFYERNNSSLDNFSENLEKVESRYIEIWNIVFMQFNRMIDGTMEPLSKLSVDTGMGLERITSVLQHVNSNYKIDLFQTLIKTAAKIIGTTNLNNKALYVIADHIRSCAFLIANDITPSNESRGYVLRRIIRRAIRHGYSLGAKDIFFYKLVSPLIEVMGTGGKILKYQQTKIEEILKTEEKRFSCTLKYGTDLLDKELKKLKCNTLSGKIAFLLHDTYGFPIDLTIDICRERNVKIDILGFENEMKKQKNLARKSSNFNINYNETIRFDEESEFLGYEFLELNSNVVAIFIENKQVDRISSGQEGIIVLDKTPFYAESGGQIGDRGKFEGFNFFVKIIDTKKYGKIIGHLGKVVLGSLKKGDEAKVSVDKSFRKRICLNHSATHLLHSALRMKLGAHVVQKGCLINDKMLRFDFSHWRAMKLEEIRSVENLINTKIRCNLPIETNIMNLEAAKAQGAIALFDNKYEKFVRVLKIGNFSIELCKGTHTLRTGDIGLFRIVSEHSISANVRRIEAVSGEEAISKLHMQSDQLHDITHLLKCDVRNLSNKVKNIVKKTFQLEKETIRLKNHIAILESANLFSKITEIKGVKLLVNELLNIEPEILRIIIDNLKNQLSPIVAVLATITKGKVFLIAGVSKDVIDRVRAEELIIMIAQKINGKGGGRSETAQVSGTNVKALSTVLNNIKCFLSAKLCNK